MAEEIEKTNKVVAALWGLAGAKALMGGIAFWTFVASQVVISGPVALSVFGVIASSSAVGIGSMVGYCAKQAQASIA